MKAEPSLGEASCGDRPVGPPDSSATEVEHHLAKILDSLDSLAERQRHLESLLNGEIAIPHKLLESSPHFRRNTLPNDSSVAQKAVVAGWQSLATGPLPAAELAASGFRVFSQNDEDGLILRIFAHVGTTNRVVVEIGNNCDGSDIGIPQNLSTNLIVHHGWHGILFEIDPKECDKLTYFFARNPATAHFHGTHDGRQIYFSPRVVCLAVTPENIESALAEATGEREPDLFVLDIDGPDFQVAQAITATRPRVLVVEFEKRLGGPASVIQPDHGNADKHWSQSGYTSLAAWNKLLGRRGYVLCAINGSGFNAFFVRADVANGRLTPITPTEAFERHPVLSHVPDDFWREPDETWKRFE